MIAVLMDGGGWAGARAVTAGRRRDGAGDAEFPQRFEEALGAIRGAIGGCETAEIPTDVILAALMAELMPRLIGAYGSYRVISVLTDLAAHIATGVTVPAARH
jgi:hypothetical protein